VWRHRKPIKILLRGGKSRLWIAEANKLAIPVVLLVRHLHKPSWLPPRASCKTRYWLIESPEIRGTAFWARPEFSQSESRRSRRPTYEVGRR